jgi:hypothetical protein
MIFLRRALKPTNAKATDINAHVPGSGTVIAMLSMVKRALGDVEKRTRSTPA